MDFMIFKEDNTELSQANIEFFDFSTELFSLYALCTIRLRDLTKTMFNQIKIGALYHIMFMDSNKGIMIENNMRTLSFKKIPGKTDSAVDFIELTLISDWYFDSTVESKSHFGSISSICKEVFARKFKNTKCSFEDTEDSSIVRFQLEERTGDFLQRILKYGIRGNLPVYLYTDHKGVVNLRGISDFLQDKPRCLAVSDVASELKIKSSDVDKSLLRMINYKIASNNSNSSSMSNTVFTTAHFISPKIKKGGVSLSNSETVSDQSSMLTPSRTKYTGWEISPEDALAVSVKENFETNMNSLYMVGLFSDFLVNEMTIGSQIGVLLPYNPVMGQHSRKNVNLGEGKYFVRQVDFIFSGGLRKTKVNLVQLSQ